MVKERSEVSQEDKWDVEGIFPTLKAWEKAFAEVSREGKTPRWPEIISHRGKLGEGPEEVKAALESKFAIARKVETLYTFAHLKHDEDIACDPYKAAFGKAVALYQELAQETSWFEPELITLPEEKIQQYLDSPILADYRFYLEKIVRMKKHTLTPDNERLIAMAGQSFYTANQTFSALNDADFKFGKVCDEKNHEHELTHASYGLFMRDQDRTLRQNTLTGMLTKYQEYENTMGELLKGQVQTHVFNKNARNYSSCLEAALYPHNIDTSVYRSLIEAVTDNIKPLHRYNTLRKKVLGLDSLHLYDMSVPLTKEIDITMSYPEAEEVIVESVAALGTEYQNILHAGLKEKRWVDRYENKNKRSGAYSSGCFDTQPYILMNYKELLRDVFTLAHEAGHSMHSDLSKTHQAYWYANYSIFLAEVASTFNEDLLGRLLIKRATSRDEKIFLINQKIDDIRNTLFRQTMFAEFELLIHEKAENHIPLTPNLMKVEYHALLKKYFGDEVELDPLTQMEWARIPHFYYNFYVYQYATGISAAIALAEGVVEGGEKERNDYLSFLKGGCSKYPIDMLQMAGVDMRTHAPVTAAIKKFDSLVDQLEDLVFSKEKVTV